MPRTRVQRVGPESVSLQALVPWCSSCNDLILRNGEVTWGSALLQRLQEVRGNCKTRNQLLPHLSMPKRGPKCKLGYHRVFNLILWLLYTGMQWKCLPVPTDTQGKPAIHYTTVYKVFAKWADDGSLWQAFVASVRHLAAEKQLDLSVLQGDGSNTVAKKGGMALGSRGTNTRRARR